MMHLILADSELERIPAEIKNHSCVKKNRSFILDASLHHSSMKKIKDWQRRGRPDIVHLFLLISQESILNKEGMLRTYVHTRNNEVIYTNPETRIIKNYNRFKGLIEQLFEIKKILYEENVLMEMKEEKLEELLSKLKGKRILFTIKGNKKRIEDVIEEDVVCIIGGFPFGDFITNVYDMADEKICIYDRMLPAWIVAMEAIVAYENKFIADKL
ncbi:MAG TPA: 16S rRNA methyltransferase [Thermoplasmatales archaeon]|nr:16S rRNA methyltransferase [Thermoplasmatales archaeon]